jgi:hypothetical protein
MGAAALRRSRRRRLPAAADVRTQRFTSPGALPQAGVPHIALRYPDLYVDAERNRPITIRWQSFNNTTGSPVRIDLTATPRTARRC